MTSRAGAEGQVAKAIRDRVQLHPGDEIDVGLQDDQIIITANRSDERLGGKFAHSGMARGYSRIAPASRGEHLPRRLGHPRLA